jgi:two-component system response regulator RegA
MTRLALGAKLGNPPTPAPGAAVNASTGADPPVAQFLDVDPEAIIGRPALRARSQDMPPPPENPMSADRVRWEHIQRVFEQCDRNV